MSSDPFKLCPYCGSEMVSRHDGPHLRRKCGSCGFIQYRNPSPAAGVLLFDDDHRVLLVKRRFEPYKGTWVIPSGYIESGESVQVTAVREMEEETGVQVELDGVHAVESCFDDPRGDTLLVIFEGRMTGGSVRAGDDAEDARFFALDGLPEIGFECQRKILSRLSAGI